MENEHKGILLAVLLVGAVGTYAIASGMNSTGMFTVELLRGEQDARCQAQAQALQDCLDAVEASAKTCLRYNSRNQCAKAIMPNLKGCNEIRLRSSNCRFVPGNGEFINQLRELATA
jgi:hypothetical protein